MNQGAPRCVTALVIVLASSFFASCMGSVDDAAGTGPNGEGPGGGGGGGPSVEIPVAADCVGVKVNEPFRVLIHRLSKTEYNNTVRDLLGDTSNPADDFPVDATGGLDNGSESLFFSEEHAAAFEKAANTLASQAISNGLIACDPATETTVACARPALQAFAERAWRRKVASNEVDGLVALVSLALTEENNFKQGLQLAVKRILLSPNFLYRPEVPSDPAAATAFRLNDHELATRLSYFLWSSMPDDELFAAARAGKLKNANEVRVQVARMLADEKAAAFVDNLAGRWLLTRETQVADRPPAFDDELRAGLQMETRLFLKAFMQEDLSLLDMMDAKFSFLTERVARHYAIGGVRGSTAQRVMLPDASHRGGLLTQANILVGTTPSNRRDLDDTNVTKRGKWILTNLFCSPPAEPPANAEVEKQKLDATLPADATRRQRTELVARGCGAGCHTTMDGLGFALEHYNLNGAWREVDGTARVDATGNVPGIGVFNGAAELGGLLKDDARFPACVANFVTAQALGRSLTDARGGWLGEKERCAMTGLASANAAKGHRLSELMTMLAQSNTFTQQSNAAGP